MWRWAKYGLVTGSLFLCLATAAQAGGQAQAQSRDARERIYGLWQTQDQDGVVELYPCEDRVCGRFVWLKDDNRANPSRDDKNPDPDLRQKPLCGLTFMGDFQSASSSGKYENGWIYSPRHGSRFSASLTLRTPDVLELRGYMLVPVLGQSQIWTRQEGSFSCYDSKSH